MTWKNYIMNTTKKRNVVARKGLVMIKNGMNGRKIKAVKTFDIVATLDSFDLPDRLFLIATYDYDDFESLYETLPCQDWREISQREIREITQKDWTIENRYYGLERIEVDDLITKICDEMPRGVNITTSSFFQKYIDMGGDESIGVKHFGRQIRKCFFIKNIEIKDRTSNGVRFFCIFD